MMYGKAFQKGHLRREKYRVFLLLSTYKKGLIYLFYFLQPS